MSNHIRNNIDSRNDQYSLSKKLSMMGIVAIIFMMVQTVQNLNSIVTLSPEIPDSPTSSADTNLKKIRIDFAEKASEQAHTIAHLIEENETRDKQLKSLHEMVEKLSGKSTEEKEMKDRQLKSLQKTVEKLSGERAEENEMNDNQLKSLHEMVEKLSEKRTEENNNDHQPPLEQNASIRDAKNTDRKGLKAKGSNTISSHEKRPDSTPKNVLGGALDTAESRTEWSEATRPWKNTTTIAFKNIVFYAGYQNQMMAFFALVIKAQQMYPDGGAQLLLNSLHHKDLFGTGSKIPHELLFDVVHWNSFYPKLPRIVTCDPILHPQFDCDKDSWNPPNSTNSSEKIEWVPEASFKQYVLFGAYQRLQGKRGGLYFEDSYPDPTDVLMLKEAVQLTPELKSIVTKSTNLMASSSASLAANNNETDNNNYMVLHARIEPDMLNHNTPTNCIALREYNLTTIFNMMQTTFPTPPLGIQKLVVLTNLKLIQKEIDSRKPASSRSEIEELTYRHTLENHATLQHAFKHGLWNGTVPVVSIGNRPILKYPAYEKFKVTMGAVIDFEVALTSRVFIGTELSSFSINIMRQRYIRGHTQLDRSYVYNPLERGGIQPWVDANTTSSTLPGFNC